MLNTQYPIRRSPPLVCVCAVLGILLSACSTFIPTPAATQPSSVHITVIADGKTLSFDLAAGLTVREALAAAGITVGDLDRLTPPPYTLISDGLAIAVTRLTEAFESELIEVPFKEQIVRNENQPVGQRRLINPGSNGVEEITYRVVYEDGVQVSRSIINRTVLTETVPAIVMVGVQSSFTIVPITGTLAYLNGNNAWVARQNSGQRRPVTFSGDLDGRVFDLAPDGQWLLYTRAVTDTASASFNTLWALPLTNTLTTTLPINLALTNTLYAEWSPVEARTFVYSTAQKISRAPGWEADNNLWLRTWSPDARRRGQLVFTDTQILDSSFGGVYGWWGTGYAMAPDGSAIAYARTDSIGVVDLATFTQRELAQFTAYNTHSDWAWFPSLAWAPGGQFVYTVTHGPSSGLELPEDSTVFNLTAISAAGLHFDLIPRAGMFANPIPSPSPASNAAERPFRIAFLQAAEPNNSPFSRYRLGVMDRDGSNLRFLFPPEGQPGLAANQHIAWSPEGRFLAVIYDGNLWLVDADTGLTQQLTGDGLSDHPAWSR
jgi:hypothetical protein